MTFFVRKAIGIVPMVLVLVTVVFFLLRLVPGGPAIAVLGDRATPDSIAAFEARWGLDRPLLVQYADYMAGLARLDFGRSFIDGSSVRESLARAVPHSILLMLAATAVSLVLGITVGVLAALRRGTWTDGASRAFALFGFSIPDFYLGVVLILLFSLQLGWLPMRGAGDWDDTADLALRLIMPALALGLPTAAVVMRIARASMLEVLPSDYLRTARAKGLSPRVVSFKHALRNALIPVVSVVGLNMGLILGNTIVLEIVFSRPGIGRLLIGSIFNRDFAVLQSTLVVYAVCIALINLLTDLAYGVVNPAIRYE